MLPGQPAGLAADPRRRGGRVAEGGGLLNRYRGSTSIVSSNIIPSANSLKSLKVLAFLLINIVATYNGFFEFVPTFVPTPIVDQRDHSKMWGGHAASAHSL